MPAPTAPRDLAELALRLADGARHYTAARRTLQELQSAFPASTHDAPPATGGGGAGRVTLDDTLRVVEHRVLDDLDPDELGHLPTSKTTPVERLAGRRDDARRALARLDELAASFGKPITEFWSLCVEWDITPHTPTINAGDTDHDYCVNHLRIGVCEPRESYKRADGTLGYRPLCSWCGDIKANYGYTPGVELLELRRDRGSKRLSDAIYRAHHPAQLRTGPKNTKRKKARK